MEQMVIALIVVALIGCLIFSRWSPPLLFSAAMAACVMVGSIDLSSVMEKATNEGLVTLLLLLMVSLGLERLPWLLSLSQYVVRRSLPKTLLGLSGMTMLFSAFVNNTAVVATLAGTLRKNPYHAASLRHGKGSFLTYRRALQPRRCYSRKRKTTWSYQTDPRGF